MRAPSVCRRDGCRCGHWNHHWLHYRDDRIAIGVSCHRRKNHLELALVSCLLEKWTHPDDVTHKDRRGLNHSFLRLYIRVFDTSDPQQGQMVGQGFLRRVPRRGWQIWRRLQSYERVQRRGPRVEEHTIYYSCVRIFAGFHIAAPPIHPSRSAYALAGVALERKIAFHTAHHQPTSPRCFKLWGGVPHLRLLAGDQA